MSARNIALFIQSAKWFNLSSRRFRTSFIQCPSYLFHHCTVVEKNQQSVTPVPGFPSGKHMAALPKPGEVLKQNFKIAGDRRSDVMTGSITRQRQYKSLQLDRCRPLLDLTPDDKYRMPKIRMFIVTRMDGVFMKRSWFLSGESNDWNISNAQESSKRRHYVQKGIEERHCKMVCPENLPQPVKRPMNKISRYANISKIPMKGWKVHGSDCKRMKVHQIRAPVKSVAAYLYLVNRQ